MARTVGSGHGHRKPEICPDTAKIVPPAHGFAENRASTMSVDRFFLSDSPALNLLYGDYDLPLVALVGKGVVFDTGGRPTFRAADRARLLGDAQRLLAKDAVHGFLYTPQWVSVADKKLRGLWKDMPVFVNDLSSLSWA